jgi:transposase-like protein
MARKARRKFSLQFKREAVRLFESSEKPVSVIAAELGIHVNVLKSWVELVKAETKSGLSGDQLEELKQLRKDKARLEMEVEILGKATAFFAKRNP